MFVTILLCIVYCSVSIIEVMRMCEETIVEGTDVNPEMNQVLIVEGDDLNYVCSFLEHSDVTVIGDVGTHLAYKMKGGKITVEGNARTEIGIHSKAGQINLGGDFKSIADDARAKIYWDNCLIGVPQYRVELAVIEKYITDFTEKR